MGNHHLKKIYGYLSFYFFDHCSEFFLLKNASLDRKLVVDLRDDFLRYDSNALGELEEDAAMRLLEDRGETKTFVELRQMINVCALYSLPLFFTFFRRLTSMSGTLHFWSILFYLLELICLGIATVPLPSSNGCVGATSVCISGIPRYI